MEILNLAITIVSTLGWFFIAGEIGYRITKAIMQRFK